MVQHKLIETFPISTKEQQADLFTKGLGRTQHQYILSKLGMYDLFKVQVLGGGGGGVGRWAGVEFCSVVIFGPNTL